MIYDLRFTRLRALKCSGSKRKHERPQVVKGGEKCDQRSCKTAKCFSNGAVLCSRNWRNPGMYSRWNSAERRLKMLPFLLSTRKKAIIAEATSPSKYKASG